MNVTGLLRRLQVIVKIENVYLFKILIQKHENVFESWHWPNFLLLPKKSGLPKIWGGCSPPRPPGPYAFGINRVRYIFHLLRFTKLKTMRALAMELSQLNTTIHNYKVEIYK